MYSKNVKLTVNKSIISSCLNCSTQLNTAAKTAVLPIPALQCTTMGPVLRWFLTWVCGVFNNSRVVNVIKVPRDDNVYNRKRNFKVYVARVAQRKSNLENLSACRGFNSRSCARSLFFNCYKTYLDMLFLILIDKIQLSLWSKINNRKNWFAAFLVKLCTLEIAKYKWKNQWTLEYNRPGIRDI